MLKQGKGRKQVLFSSASLLCWCSRIAANDPPGDAEKQAKVGKQYAEEAVKRLSEAIDAGFDDLAAVESDTKFKVLAERTDFQKQIKRLSQKK